MSTPPLPSRSTVPERFLSADRYRARREWFRYEGTPQRDLLRRVRESFLSTTLRRSGRRSPLTLEVGPGPGRFTPILSQRSDRLVLLDASIAMLREGHQRRAKKPFDPRCRVGEVVADAGMLPLTTEISACTVALGNVLGFAGSRAPQVFDELVRSLGRRGVLVVETASPILGMPSFTRGCTPRDWRRMVSQPPASLLPSLLRQGFSKVIPPASRYREEDTFQFLDPQEIRDWISDAGLSIEDQMVAAPMTGGSPELVADVTHGRQDALERLVEWELFAGRRKELLMQGGHTLTAARAP